MLFKYTVEIACCSKHADKEMPLLKFKELFLSQKANLPPKHNKLLKNNFKFHHLQEE